MNKFTMTHNLSLCLIIDIFIIHKLWKDILELIKKHIVVRITLKLQVFVLLNCFKSVY